MKKFFWLVSLFALMFLGYPEVSNTIGLFVKDILEHSLCEMTGYSIADLMEGFDAHAGLLRSLSFKVFDAIEYINPTYLGAALVAEVGTVILSVALGLRILRLRRKAKVRNRMLSDEFVQAFKATGGNNKRLDLLQATRKKLGALSLDLPSISTRNSINK